MEKIKDKNYVKSEMFEIEPQDINEGFWENALLVAGFIPVIGEVADTILIIKYWREGRKIEAGLMLLALIPTVGDIIVKPFLRLGKAAGAFKTATTFTNFITKYMANNACFVKRNIVVKYMTRKVYAMTKNIVASTHCAFEGCRMFKIMRLSM